MSNLIELSRRLHQERLFTKHEQETIWKLNKQVQSHAEQVSHLFWVSRQHYLNLNKLILDSSQGTSAACCRRSHALDSVQFVDGCKELGYQEESMYSQFIETFLNNPTLAAACVAYGDKLGLEATADVARTIVLSCYGNNIMTDDHKQLLELMETLMLLQLACEDQPRRLLHKRKCAFSVVLKLFMESLPLGKLFLTFALHKSVMEVLMDDDLLLETNQQKILTQLSSYEIEKRFGRPDSSSFQEKMKEHVKTAEKHLVKICASFISNIFSAMSCFPQSLGWIIARSYQIVKDAGLVSQEEARALCSDIFLQQFVCPAIVSPELYGVTGDVPVSDVSRSNLIQIAQVLQVMAHVDDTAQRSDSIYSQINIDPMQTLIDSVINSCSSDTAPQSHKSPLGYANSAVFFTPFQLAQLIQFLRAIKESEVRGVDQASLEAVLSHLPTQPPSCMEIAFNQLNQSATEDEGSGNAKTGHLTPSGGSSGDLVDLGHPSPSKRGLTVNGRGKRFGKKDDQSESMTDDAGSGDVGSDNLNETVLVITLNSLSGNSQELLGTLTESEVMELRSNRNNSASNLPAENASLDARSLTGTEGLEKRSRFSLYSGGSDLSEIDEELPTEDVISRTSGSSSIDIDPAENVPPDDTSSFHAVSIPTENQDEDEEGVDQGSVSRANNDEALKALRRKLPTSRGESIDDKMRKFEIRQELGVRFADPGVTLGESRASGVQGGAVSADARSETWSMDAYASDSEAQTEHDSQSERLQEFVEENPQPIRSSSNANSFLVLQREEDSRSDVWSVEVLASDSEPPDVQTDDRLQEFESEAAAAPSEDVLEDNRSRASTPGLSAASGFSAVSALSVVSESHAKAADDPWQYWSKSFVKEPSSVSPDADDLLQLSKMEGSSGGSHSTGSEHNNRGKPPHSSSPFPKTQQSPPLIEKNRREPSDVNKPQKGAGKLGDVVYPLPKTSSINKSVAWNVSDLSSSSADSSKTAGNDASDPGLLDPDASANTIKRSPNKRSETESKASAAPGSSKPVDRAIAWDEKRTASPVNDTAAASILKDFDPLLSSVEKTSKTDTSEVELITKTAVPNQDVTDASKSNAVTANGGVELAGDKALRSSSPSEAMRLELAGKTSTPQPEGSKLQDIPDFLMRRSNKKPSWWKSFSKRKAPNKSVSASDSAIAEENRTRGSANTFSALEETPRGQKKPFGEEVTSPVDDIMQKYMKKVPKTRLDAETSTSGGDGSPRKSPETDDVTNRNASEPSNDGLTPSSSNHDLKSAHSSAAPSSVPFASGWSGEGQSATSGEAESKPADLISPKTEADLKEEAKRKLRIVFSSAEPLPESPSLELLLLGISSSSANSSFIPPGESTSGSSKLKLREHLLSFLRTQQAEALTLLMHSRVAQIDEVLRCVQALDDQSCKQVIKSLWREYKQRSSYIAYLVRSRQHLLASLSYLRHVTDCTERDKAICRRYFTVQCVRMFLKNKHMESELIKFRSKFIRSIALDEKVSLIRRFLSWLYGHMVENPIWEGASQEQLEEGESCIERYLFSIVYKPALFPNAEGDTHRDQVFHEHISRLATVITPSHPALQINPRYMQECPWPSAQREVSALAAFRSPRGKLQAALRCCRAVMHLLKMADESQVPAADDFTPVLVFVLIQANPPHLLSTLQYIESFIGDQLGGEDAYWWMQFSAATIFIKTIK